MTLIGRVLREVWALFVDDGTLALFLVAWTALVGVVVRLSGSGTTVAGPVLLVGILVILIENVRRFAVRRSASSDRDED